MDQNTSPSLVSDRRSRRWLWAALALGLVVRVGVVWSAADLPVHIGDEVQYVRLAENLLAGHGFGYHPEALTSHRPPLYPAFLAAVWSLSGPGDLQAVRWVQIVLSFATAWLVFLIGRKVYGETVGRWAAAVTILYPSFVYTNVLLLTETLFTFLLTAFVYLTVTTVQSPRLATAIGAGAVLGLGALTRSVLWPLPLVLCPMLALLIRGPLARRVAIPVALVIGYAAVVAPWAVRNTQLQGTVTIVDTMGGLNLRMGNYEYTPEDRMWDAISIEGERSWYADLLREFPGQALTEGEKDRWAQRKALAYMAAHPGTTLRRAAIKFGDFWGLEREFLAGVQHGYYTPPLWATVAGGALILASYPLLVLVGGIGAWLAAPRDWRHHLLLLLPVLLLTGVHSLVFGHSRYHLPLIPILGLYGAALVHGLAPLRRGEAWPPAATLRLAGAAATVVLLVGFWVRQTLVVDAERIRGLIANVL